MRAKDALRVLAAITADQWGMVTTAQAGMHAVTRLDLSRLSEAGHFNRLASGVYQDAGSPSSPFDDLHAAWLSTDPKKTAADRLHNFTDEVVVAGTSAAALHGIGDLPSDTHEFVSPTRRQTQRPDIHYRKMELDPQDVTIVDGLPVMTMERCIADLIEQVGDLSLAADALRDSVQKRTVDKPRLRGLLARHARTAGFPRADGAALLSRLEEIAGIDNDAVARRLVASDEPLATRVAVNFLEHLDLGKVMVTPEIQKAIGAALRDAMVPATQNVRAIFTVSAIDETAKKMAEQLATSEVMTELNRSWMRAAIRDHATDPELGAVVREPHRRIAAPATGDADA